jgi:hypothetical protein
MMSEDWDLTRTYIGGVLDTGDGYLHLGSDDVAEFNADGDLIVGFDNNSWVALNGHIVSFFCRAQRQGKRLARICSRADQRRKREDHTRLERRQRERFRV